MQLRIPNLLLYFGVLFDSHAHLDDEAFADDLDSVLSRAREAGVGRIVTVGTDAESSRRACEIAETHDGVEAAVGSHPHTADQVSSVEELRPLAGRAAAVGETGLDAVRMHADMENQKRLFVEHMKLAKETGLPIIIHCREAHAECRAMLREHLGTPIRGVVHCFSGTAEDARDYLDLGMVLSIAGPVTFPKAGRLRNVARTIPPDRLLVETDSPLLAPQPRRGKRNEPSYVKFTAESLAEVLRVPFDKLAETTCRNAENLFARS